MKKYIFMGLLLVFSFLLVGRVDASNISSNNNLETLNASGTDLQYVSGQDVYDVVYASKTDSIKIYATLDDENAKFVDDFGPRVVYLNYGDNVVLVKVQAENGDVRTYTINIFRKDIRSNNNYLDNIVVNGSVLNFDKDKLIYSFSVPYSVSNLEIKYSKNDSNAKVSILNSNLSVGNNKVSLIVSAENGDKRTYTLNVYRSKSEVLPLSGNTTLALLKVEGYNIDFDSNVFEYKLKVKDDAPLSIKALAKDEKSSVKIVGNDKITNNGVVEIRVIAEDGSLGLYKINITIEGMLKMDKIWIVVSVISGVALLSFLVIILSKLIGKKKNEGATMNLEVVRQSAPVVDTNSKEDQQLMSFLLGGNAVGQKPCPYCGTLNNSNSVNCSNCGNNLGNTNQL